MSISLAPAFTPACTGTRDGGHRGTFVRGLAMDSHMQPLRHGTRWLACAGRVPRAWQHHCAVPMPMPNKHNFCKPHLPQCSCLVLEARALGAASQGLAHMRKAMVRASAGR